MKVAFLDRDGVINKEVNYLHRIEDWEFTPGCIEGLLKLQSMNFQFVIVTNQAGIARGFYDEGQYQKLTNWYLDRLLEEGIEILDVFHCPHHPDGKVPELATECHCRKPNIGMLEAANQKYDVDLVSSIIVGDKISDLQAGLSFGLQQENVFLVKTGHAIEGSEWVKNTYENLFELAKAMEVKGDA